MLHDGLSAHRYLRAPESAILPPPDVIAQEIVEDLEAALVQFRLIAADLSEGEGNGRTRAEKG